MLVVYVHNQCRYQYKSSGPLVGDSRCVSLIQWFEVTMERAYFPKRDDCVMQSAFLTWWLVLNTIGGQDDWRNGKLRSLLKGRDLNSQVNVQSLNR